MKVVADRRIDPVPGRLFVVELIDGKIDLLLLVNNKIIFNCLFWVINSHDHKNAIKFR